MENKELSLWEQLHVGDYFVLERDERYGQKLNDNQFTILYPEIRRFAGRFKYTAIDGWCPKRKAIKEEIPNFIKQKNIVDLLGQDFEEDKNKPLGKLYLAEKELIEKELIANRYNKTQTAKALGISRNGLTNKLKEYFGNEYIKPRG